MSPPLSLSILGVEPLDEFIREIADFIHYHIMNCPPDLQGKIEVEAKVGLLRDRNTNSRLMLPILTETILAPDGLDIRFESNMSSHQHRHFNTRLNELKMASSQSSFPSTPLEYNHLHLIDSFYASSENPKDKEKIRVTRDEKTGNVLECMRKVRLGDLNIYNPKRHADWRVSVNVEIPVQHPVGSVSHTRKKDRLSYTHQEFIIDLTQVTASYANGPSEILHELELEIARPAFLLAIANKRADTNASETERAAFDELIRAFVNNARILVKNATENW
ncbi:unnamed protein product [Mycena citricolor]|uniref:mRNA-capping enzyme subunit beta n=1 Tax=Mycena citricolor TaxID=2018698 RepID=A0AAD2Q7C8_9AGAR|nr:unnamed protein product [Mycena citricolor]